MDFWTFSPMCCPSSESDRHAISARLRSGGGYRSDVNYRQSIEKPRFRLFKKVSDARRARNRSFGLAQDKLGRGVFADTLKRGDRAQRQTV
jgi:hypothetical protein